MLAIASLIFKEHRHWPRKQGALTPVRCAGPWLAGECYLLLPGAITRSVADVPGSTRDCVGLSRRWGSCWLVFVGGKEGGCRTTDLLGGISGARGRCCGSGGGGKVRTSGAVAVRQAVHIRLDH